MTLIIIICFKLRKFIIDTGDENDCNEEYRIVVHPLNRFQGWEVIIYQHLLHTEDKDMEDRLDDDEELRAQLALKISYGVRTCEHASLRDLYTMRYNNWRRCSLELWNQFTSLLWPKQYDGFRRCHILQYKCQLFPWKYGSVIDLDVLQNPSISISRSTTTPNIYEWKKSKAFWSSSFPSLSPSRLLLVSSSETFAVPLSGCLSKTQSCTSAHACP